MIVFGIKGNTCCNNLFHSMIFFKRFVYFSSNRFVNSLTVYYSNDVALIYLGTDSKNYL